MAPNDLFSGCTHSNVIRESILGIAPLSSQENMLCDFSSHFLPCVLAAADIDVAFLALFASFARRGVDDHPITSAVIFFNAPFLQLQGVSVLTRKIARQQNQHRGLWRR